MSFRFQIMRINNSNGSVAKAMGKQQTFGYANSECVRNECSVHVLRRCTMYARLCWSTHKMRNDWKLQSFGEFFFLLTNNSSCCLVRINIIIRLNLCIRITHLPFVESHTSKCAVRNEASREHFESFGCKICAKQKSFKHAIAEAAHWSWHRMWNVFPI